VGEQRIQPGFVILGAMLPHVLKKHGPRGFSLPNEPPTGDVARGKGTSS